LKYFTFCLFAQRRNQRVVAVLALLLLAGYGGIDHMMYSGGISPNMYAGHDGSTGNARWHDRNISKS
ncbi:hypothetical protein ACUIJN_25810, partial [Metabacillus halosaccharovorans]|uniref:hypothetical protein n=1 Tax=Metabacillus halosaccharovorans TaxID=930124 RepID=UPI00403E098B